MMLGDGPYRSTTFRAPTKKTSVVEKYKHLFLAADDALWREWVDFWEADYSKLKELLEARARIGFKARAVLALFGNGENSLYRGKRIAKKNAFPRWLEEVPEELRRFAADLVFERVERERDREMNGILIQIAKTYPEDARRAVDLLDQGPKRGYDDLLRLIVDQEQPIDLRRYADTIMKTVVAAEIQSGICDKEMHHYNCAAEAYERDLDWTRDRRRGDPLVVEQYYFLAEVGSPYFCTYSTVDLLKTLLRGPEHVRVRCRILELYVRPGSDTMMMPREFDPEWLAELQRFGRKDLADLFREGIRQGAERQAANEKWQRDREVATRSLAERMA